MTSDPTFDPPAAARCDRPGLRPSDQKAGVGAARVESRAPGIARGARFLVGLTVVAIAATTARVVELKVAPRSELVGSMQHEDGRPIQVKVTSAGKPRGRILDAKGRILAVDTISGRLFVDVADLYRDAMNQAIDALRRARRTGGEGDDGGRGRIALRDLPADLDPITDLAAALEPHLGMPRDAIVARITRRLPAERRTLRRDMPDEAWSELPRYAVISEDLTAEQVEALAAARRDAGPKGVLRGAHVEIRPDRVNPFEELARSLVGLTGVDAVTDAATGDHVGEAVVGRSGVEFVANRNLLSDPGRTEFITDRLGSVISVPANGHRDGRSGEDFRLSIDMVVQEIVQREIDRTVAEANAGGGRCIVADVRTGEIVAAYDVLRTNTGRSPIAEDPAAKVHPALSRLRWVTDPFEPGSIFKPFIWAWSLELGKARPNETIHLPEGPLTISDGRARRTIREAHSSSYGSRSWHDCLTKSVNAGMVTVAMRMTSDEMKECLSSFGFGRRTMVGLSGESAGLLPRADEWTNRTRALASVSFGQGIAVTPLQLVRAFTAFCREDGSMVPLAVVPPAAGSLRGSMPAIGADAARETREAMQDVITQGTGKKMKDILVYSAFGKSGTAQLVNPKGGYFQDRYMSSFIVGAPFDRPELVVLVTIEDPDRVKTKGSYGGGSLAGPCAARIVNGALGYLGVPTRGELVYSDKKPAKAVARAE